MTTYEDAGYMKNDTRLIGIILAAALLFSLCACSDSRGRTVHYDGYTVRTEKTGEQKAEPAVRKTVRSANDEAEEDYVLNISSMKFHYPFCSGAAEIKESNRWNYRGTRESVIEMGYSPCKLCDP